MAYVKTYGQRGVKHSKRLSKIICKQRTDMKKTKNIHISQIKADDTVFHDDHERTVNDENLKRDFTMGKTLFGDSYNLGYKPVKLVVFDLSKLKLI